MIKLKDKSIKILQVLATFKFLNTNHLLRLRAANHRSNLHSPLKELIFHNMIWKISFGVDPRYWKLANYYYLKNKWKEFLILNMRYHENSIKIPIGTSSMFIRDYYHRTNAIDFQIELFLYAAFTLKAKVTVYDTYYDFTWESKGSTLKAKTKLIFDDWSYFIPDAVIKLEVELKMKIYAFEIYNWMNTKRVIEQLKKHMVSLQQWLLSFALNEKIGSKVLILFDSKEACHAVISRVLEDPVFRNYKNLFLFSYLDLIKSDFNSWYYFDWTKAVF